MSDYFISQVYPSDARTNAQVDALLQQEGIRRDANLDYTCVMFDNDYHAIATGSCFGNTLRCMAVDHRHQGEGLMNEIVSHLVQYQYERGNLHLFLYTKRNSAKFFGDLGFYEIARIQDQIVFMENRKDGFSSYLDQLAQTKVDAPKVGAIVMNANPFTLGHQYLVEKAAAENDVVHLFMVSEDASLFPYAVRRQLIEAGTRTSSARPRSPAISRRMRKRSSPAMPTWIWPSSPRLPTSWVSPPGTWGRNPPAWSRACTTR